MLASSAQRYHNRVQKEGRGMEDMPTQITPENSDQPSSEVLGEPAAPRHRVTAKRLRRVSKQPAQEESDALSEDTDEPISSNETYKDSNDEDRITVFREHKQTTEGDLMRMYLNDIGKIPLLSASDEVELSQQIEVGLLASQVEFFKKADDDERIELKLDMEKSIIKRLEKEAKEARQRAHGTEDDVYKGLNAKQRSALDQKLAGERSEAAHNEAQSGIETISSLTTKLSDEDIAELIADGLKARNRMIESNLRLVVKWAKQSDRIKHMKPLDVINEGNTGLIRAVEKFDYTLGWKFSTYASWWIRQAISRSKSDQDHMIRVPVHMNEQLQKLDRTNRRLAEDFGQEPSHEELAKELNITLAQLADLYSFDRTANTVSLDLPVGQDASYGNADSFFGDYVADTSMPRAEDEAEASELRKTLQTVLSTLDEREASVIRMHFGLDGNEPMTLDEIGSIYGVTRERIRQIESRAKAKLRHPSRSGILEGFL